MIKLFTLFTILVYSLTSYAEFKIHDVSISCQSKDCSDEYEIFNTLKRSFNDQEHFHEVLKYYIAYEGVQTLSYELKMNESGMNILDLDVRRKTVVSAVKVSFKGKHSIEVPALLPLRVDSYLDESKVRSTAKLLKEIAANKGYPGVRVSTLKKSRNNKTQITFIIKLGLPVIVTKVEVNSKSEYISNYVKKKMSNHLDRRFDLQDLKNDVDKLRLLFIDYGHYLITLEMKYRYLTTKTASVFINVKNLKLYSFAIDGNKRLETKLIRDHLSNLMLTYKREIETENVTRHIKELYEKNGFFKTKVIVKERKFSDVNNEMMFQKVISIDEGERYQIKNINFRGNLYFSSNELRELFYSMAPEEAQQGYVNQQYLEQFSEILKKYYVKHGFVNFIFNKLISTNVEGSKVEVIYDLREGTRAYTSEIKIIGVNQKIKQEILEIFTNRFGRPFNPIDFSNDLHRIKEFFQSEGYYFAKIRNLNSNDLVKYEQNNSSVRIKLDINLGKKLFLDQIIIIGNKNTRKRLIKREVGMKNSELITKERLENAQTNLLRLGIFRSVKVKPTQSRFDKTDILIFVKEKDFGSIELAPGVRSDLGFKLSGTIAYNNFEGMNKRISLKGTVNRRFNLNTLDSRRKDSSPLLVEYDAAINYAEDHIFKSNFDFETSLSKSRKRFFSFDADIQRLNFTVSKDLTKWLKLSLIQQVETISQFDATDSREHGHFQIGSLTPALTFDFRNDRVNPTSGAYFNFSTEFANQAFLSQSNNDLAIDYYKFINRNRFYVPMNNLGVLAISTTFGIQENNKKKFDASGKSIGYVPNIKVFRLTGMDIIRGFEDSEANRLISGDDISEVEINKRAYMVNLKIEPRFYLSDNTMLGVFYDAGRIFVNEIDESALRSSAGLSFKYLTPVGSVDFDYGIKLLRKRDSSGKLESPGRLHVSIGFF